MQLEQIEHENRVHVRIPHENMNCPSCRRRTLNFLTESLTTEKLQLITNQRLFKAEEPLRCGSVDCSWEGTAFDVYYAESNGKKPAKTRGEYKAISVDFKAAETRVLKEALFRAELEYRAHIVAEEIGEGGTPEREEMWRQKLLDLQQLMKKLS